MTDLEKMAKTARELANKLFASDEAACSQMSDKGSSCVQAEGDRPLTRAEKLQGWASRPFYAYSTEKMCAGCAAYWHAERAAQILHEMRCWQRRAEVEGK